MRKVTTHGSTEPVAFVTKGRQRVKQYNNNSVYLNNGSEFELELFNPTTSKVMAKIELNGTSIGAGIVLRPGERVFIERYLDEARKFMFQTYEVNGSNEDVKQAIANNGDVRVLFYKESTPIIYTTNTWTTTWPTWGTCTYTDNIGYSSPSGGSNYSSSTASGQACLDNVNCFNGRIDTGASYNNTSLLDFTPQSLSRSIIDNPSEMHTNGGNQNRRRMSKSLKSSKSLETGRIDKGSVSNQTFGHDYSTFDTYWTWSTQWKILPTSQKPLVREDIKVFCANCGSRRKKESHKFCPNCGFKF